MGAATDNLESDKYIHSAQKEVYGPESISAVYGRTPVTRTYRGRYKIQKIQFAM